jgi:hypothetical protein
MGFRWRDQGIAPEELAHFFPDIVGEAIELCSMRLLGLLSIVKRIVDCHEIPRQWKLTFD